MMSTTILKEPRGTLEEKSEMNQNPKRRVPTKFFFVRFIMDCIHSVAELKSVSGRKFLVNLIHIFKIWLPA